MVRTPGASPSNSTWWPCKFDGLFDISELPVPQLQNRNENSTNIIKLLWGWHEMEHITSWTGNPKEPLLYPWCVASDQKSKATTSCFATSLLSNLRWRIVLKTEGSRNTVTLTKRTACYQVNVYQSLVNIHPPGYLLLLYLRNVTYWFLKFPHCHLLRKGNSRQSHWFRQANISEEAFVRLSFLLNKLATKVEESRYTFQWSFKQKPA